QHASEVSGALVGERRRPQLLGEPGELSLRPHVQASLLPSCDHHAVPQVFSELRREEYPPLVIQTWGVSAEEHGPPPHLWAPRPGRCPPRTLLSSIGHHSTPHHPTCNHFHTTPIPTSSTARICRAQKHPRTGTPSGTIGSAGTSLISTGPVTPLDAVRVRWYGAPRRTDLPAGGTRDPELDPAE